MIEGSASVAKARFRERLTGFLRFLRARQFPVGVGAEVDLAAATESIDVLDRSQLRAACSATLAKSPEELRYLEMAFDRFWGARDATLELPWTGGETATLAPARRPRPARERPPSGTPTDAPPPVVIPLGTYSASAPSSGHPLAPVDAREVRQLRRGARRFRRENATRAGRRDARANRGVVDLRETVRRSLHHGGEWIELARRRPRPARAEFVVLWDVSGSMREHDDRFFALVHALESLSRRGRVFAFSTRVQEVTEDVRRYGYVRAAAIVGRRIERADGGTRIGPSLHEFAARYGGRLNDRSTIVILSDGWDLGETEEVAYELALLRRRVHRVVWVTPYTRRPGFRPEVGALRAAAGEIDQLLGPEDFESRWPLRPFRA